MPVLDVVTSIQQIQSGFTTLFGTPPPTPAVTPAAASFATQLQKAAGPPGAYQGDGTATGQNVVDLAKTYLGVPYVFGGTDYSGIDCSGLVQSVYRELGIELPRGVSGQMTQGVEVPSLAEARPGDLIVTDGGDHISIYAGDGMVIHAPYEGRTVSHQKLWVGDEGITTIRRILPDAAPVTAGVGAAAGPIPTGVSALLGSSLGAGSMSPTAGWSADQIALLQALLTGGSR